ncbi:hypothetical protein ACFX1R_036145 [Malus domestica]
MQFNGKGNPKQHVAHFVETCNNAGTEGDYLAKQFVRSLKGNAFEWYTDLEPESINRWEQLEREFLNRFYSTRRTVSMLELTSTKQWKDEPVIDYINRWRTLSLDCKDRLSETSSIEMCIQGMRWGLQYILQGIKPRTFEELAIRAHDMELSIAHHGKKEPIVDYKNDKVLGPKLEKTAWKPTKEAMTINTTPVKIPTRGKAIQTEAFRDQEMRRHTLNKLPTVHPRSSLDGPWINETSTNQQLTEIESEDQNRERLNPNTPQSQWHQARDKPFSQPLREGS